jgi:DNA-directed RNA polymerase specialized sigma subunit
MSGKRPVPPLTPERQALVDSLGRLPEEEAARVASARRAGYLLDELEAAARLGAARAAATYTAVDGATFADLAKCHIRGACHDLLRHEVRQQNYHRAAEMASHHACSQVTPLPEDAVDPRKDDDACSRQKLGSYVKAKLSAITLAFWLESEKTEPDPESAALLKPFFAAMRADVGELRASDQELLRCVYAEGMDLRDAAAQVNLAYPTAKVRHRKLLLRLRESFEKRGLSHP